MRKKILGDTLQNMQKTSASVLMRSSCSKLFPTDHWERPCDRALFNINVTDFHCKRFILAFAKIFRKFAIQNTSEQL